GVENSRLGAADTADILGGTRGDARHALQKVQRHPLALEHVNCRPGHGAQNISGLYLFPVAYAERTLNNRIEPEKNLPNDLKTSDHNGGLGRENGTHLASGLEDGCRGDVLAVFGKGQVNDALDEIARIHGRSLSRD